MNKVTIVVSGEPSTGSIAVAAAVDKYLQHMGFNTTFFDPDFPTEDKPSFVYSRDAVQVAREISGSVEVEIRTHQQPRNGSLIQVIPDESIPRGEAVLVSKNSEGKIVDAARAVNLQTKESYPCPNECKNGKDLLWCRPGGPGNQLVVDCNVCGGRGRVSAVVLAEWNYWRGNSEGPDAVRAVNLQTEEKQS